MIDGEIIRNSQLTTKDRAGRVGLRISSVPPTVLVELDFEPGRQALVVGRRVALVTRHPGAAAVATVRAFPWPAPMVFTDPSRVSTEDALHARSRPDSDYP
jgi:hypothetical protein